MFALTILPLLVASAYAGDVIAHAVEPLPQYTQEQNTATGEYGYSYSGGPSAKTEFRAPDGTTTGTYSYIDAHGIYQTVNYIADEFGFRASGSNIPSEGSVPLDAPDVAAAKAAHLAEHSRATYEALSHHRRKRGLALAPIAHASILPVATSSQSIFQIHNSARLISAHPVIATHPVIASHGLLYRKKRGLALAAPLPPSSAKIYNELSNQPILAHAAPIATALHAPIATPLHAPIATALHAPIAAPAPLIAKAALPATSFFETTVPLATSSQSRFQIHNSAKIIEQVHQPIYAPIATPAYYPIAENILPAKPAFLPNEPFLGAAAALPAFAGNPEAIIAENDAIAVESA